MAGLSLKHIYKVYPGRKNKKGLVQKIKELIKKDKEEAPSAQRTGDYCAVKDFNMEIEDGEFIVFVGPSGCGKSTTLRMIAGLEDITAGELTIGDRRVNEVDAKDRDIAMVFQNYALYPHMTSYQNIAFGLKLRKIPVPKVDKEGNPVIAIDNKKIKDISKKIKEVADDIETAANDQLKEILLKRKEMLENDLKYYQETPVQIYVYKHMPKEEIDEKVRWAAKVLGIEELLDSKPAEMSGGQRQRIALGRAIVREPKVMLLDEPLSNLDAKLRTSMRSEIVRLHNQLKTTFIYVTHDQIEAMTMGTRIVVMKLGVIQQIDTPTNLFDYPDNKFVAGFIGTPQMNFFDVTVKKVGGKLVTKFANGEEVNYDLSKLRTINKELLDGEEHEVIIGVRGTNISLSEKGISTKLSIKEILGDTTQLFVKLTEDGSDIIVCLSERNDYVAGDTVKIAFNEKHIHMFDKLTEHSLMSREYGN